MHMIVVGLSLLFVLFSLFFTDCQFLSHFHACLLIWLFKDFIFFLPPLRVKQTRHLQQLQKLANLFLLYLHWLQKLYTCFGFDNQCIRGLNEWTGLLFQSATIWASSEKAEYKRQHDLSSHGQLWSCQQKITTNMQFELQQEPFWASPHLYLYWSLQVR